MPSHKSAEKRLRQNKKRYRKNMGCRSRLRNAIRSFNSIDDAETLTERFPQLVSIIDKSKRKGIINSRKAARLKSTLSERIAHS